MKGFQAPWHRPLVAGAVACLVVVTPIEFLPAPLVVGTILMARWSRKVGAVGLAVPAAVATAIVAAAATAPVETISDRLMRRLVSIPKLAMTVAELSEPEEHGLPRLQPRFEVYAPEGLCDRVVHFTALDMTVGDFIAAVEAQTGMRHRFRSCGNGWTILWGPDNITSLAFIAPE